MVVVALEGNALGAALTAVTALAELARRGAGELLGCCLADRAFKREAWVASLLDLEQSADTVFARVMDVLPELEGHPRRPTLYMLAVNLEDAVDQVYAAAIQLVGVGLPNVPKGGVELVAAAVSALDHLLLAVRSWMLPGGLARARWHAHAAHKLAMDGDVEFVTHLADVLNGPMDADQMVCHREFLDGVRHLLHLVDDAAVVLASPQFQLAGPRQTPALLQVDSAPPAQVGQGQQHPRG